jgi:hypothetical protein
MSSVLLPVDAWDNFYVIIGSSAAGLTGLTFVVIALAADAMTLQMWGLRTFVTPVVMHFGSALWLSALLCIPGQTAGSLSACMIASGAILGAYGGATTYRMYRGRKDYRPAIEDWIWNATLPLLCYLGLLVAGVLALQRTAAALYIIGAAALTLLFVGVHNAWDLAVWMTVEGPAAKAKRDAEGAAKPEAKSEGAGHEGPERSEGREAR